MSKEDSTPVLTAIRASQPARGTKQPLLCFLWRPWTSLWLSFPTSFRRSIYRCLWWAGERLCGRGTGFVQHVPFGLYLKFGPPATLRSGALATIFVATNTTIPVPTTLDFVHDGEYSMTLMTQIPGISVRHDILNGKLTEQYFESTMRDWLTQLRALPVPDPQRVSSFDGGQCLCFRVHKDPFGPYPDISSFHRKLVDMCPPAEGRMLGEHVVQKSHDKPHRIYFTHGDLHVHNILADNGRITGLIDWDCAGWYPEYWDYAVAIYHIRRHPFWVGCFSRMFPQYEDELEVEKAIWEVHCPW